jgi:hypothetical protein
LHACRSTLEDPPVAAALIEHGAYVALLDRDAAAVAETAAQLGPRAQSVVVDVAAVHEVTAAIEDVITRWGRLDILVNNAVVLSTAPGTELEFVIMVIAVSCVKLLSAHNSTQHTSRKHKV